MMMVLKFPFPFLLQDAQAKFIEIQNAYEILSDPTKRSTFDRYGTTDPPPPARTRRQHPGGFTSTNFYHRQLQEKEKRKREYFRSRKAQSRYSTKLTHNNFEGMVYSSYGAKQHTVRIWLVFAYAHDCQACEVLKPAWEEASKLLLRHGIARTGTINSEFEYELNKKLEIRSVPSVYTMRVYGGGRRRALRRVKSITSRTNTASLSAASLLDLVTAYFVFFFFLIFWFLFGFLFKCLVFLYPVALTL